MRILGIIPARGGSKGVPDKNIVDLCGKPLLAYTAEAALNATRLSRVILSTDSEKIAQIGRVLGLDVPFLRPDELAQDDTPTLPVLKHALEQLERTGELYDAVCLLQPTSPLRTATMIDEACRLFMAERADTLLSVLPVPHQYHPDWAMILQEDGSLHWATGKKEPITRRQLLPPAFHREGSLYIARARLVLEQGTLYGRRIIPYKVDPSLSINIDSPADLDVARRLIAGPRRC